MKYAKLKLALGIAAAILLAGGATTAVISQISGQAKILVKGLFVKVPTKNFAAIMNEFAKPVIPTDPHSRAFRDFIQQHSAVIFLGAPTITTGNGVKANISLTNAVTINGTNANVGITFDVLPTIQSDSNITIKFKAELRELTSGTLPSIHVTKIEEQMKGMHSGLTGAVRAKIGGDGATVGRNQDESETLLISINAAEVK